MAHFTQDPALVAAFTANLDLHSLTTYNVFPQVREAAEKRAGGKLLDQDVATQADVLSWIAETFGDQRKKAKTLNFEIIYGVGPKKLAEQLDITESAAREMLDGWFRGYPNVKRWMTRTLQEYREKGHARTLMGRYRRANLAKLNAQSRGLRGSEERTLLNALVQGSAADVCERAMILLDEDEELKGLGVVALMQVHDEVVLAVPKGNHLRAKERVKEVMEHPFSKPLRVPLPVSVGYGSTWAGAKH